MRRLSLVIAMAAFGASSAEAASFTFETTALGVYSSLGMTDSGLTLTLTRTSGNDFEVNDAVSRPVSWGTHSLENFCCGFPAGDAYNANFSQPVTSFSIQFGDFGPSDVDSPVVLRLYSGLDGTGSLIATIIGSWGANDSFPSFGTLSYVSGLPILSARFAGEGAQFPNSLFWDNITVSAVPEPMTLLLLGSGLAGLVARRRRRVS